MFWPFIAATTADIGFFKLGALSVWVSVLSLTIQVLTIALFALGGLALCRSWATPAVTST